MTLSLCAPIVVLRPAGLSDGEALTRTFQSFPVQRLRPAHPKSVRDFTAPGTILIRGLHSASRVRQNLARYPANLLHVSALPSFAFRHGEQRNEGQIPNETKLRARPGNLTARGGNVSG